MKKESIVLSSKSVELSEHKGYLLLVNRVCYYGEPNMNGVSLSKDTAEQYAQTLVDMPVYAKYVPNYNGEPSFGGHEAYIDEDGEVAFDTMPIGVHTSAEVRDDLVEVSEGRYESLPCLFATQKIWTRNKNVVAAVKRLFSEGKLYNSWEISYDTCRYLEGGGKELIDYTFEGNCFLGVDNFNYPAYGPSAEVISLSALQQSEATLLVATAAAKDIAAGEGMENVEGGETAEMENEMDTTMISESETNPVVEEVSAEENPVVENENEPQDSDVENSEEISSNEDDSESEEEPGNSQEEESAVESEDTSVGNEDAPTEAPGVTMEDLISTIAKLNQSLDAANEQIASLVSELEVYRAAEREAQIAELRQYVIDAGCFSNDEIENDVAPLISSLDKGAIAQMIADRMVAAARKKAEPAKRKTSASVNVAVTNAEVSEKNWRPIMKDFFSK